jgi:MATE family multidrug resistance protein
MSGIRTGYWLGRNDPVAASRTGWVAFGLGGVATLIVSLMLLPFATKVMGVVTSDQEVIDMSAVLLPAVMLNIIAGIAVEVGTGGVLTSQGRPSLVTFLSFAFELPLSLGSVAVLVLLFHSSLGFVYWAQAIVMVGEGVVVWIIIMNTDWAKQAAEAQERQADEDACSPQMPSPGGRASPTLSQRGRATPMKSPMLSRGPTREILDMEKEANGSRNGGIPSSPARDVGISMQERKK